MTATQLLGDYLSQFSQQEIEQDIMEKALMCLIDTLGLSFSARSEPTAAAALALCHQNAFNEKGTATAWINGVRLAPTDAAFANGVAAHAHFQDDTDHDSWTHPGSLVPPAVVALAERENASLVKTLRALIAGYSVINWLGRNEVVARALIQRGFRTSPTLGTMGAAAGSAILLGLNRDAAASAIGIAASMTGGTLEPVRSGSDEWRVQNGRAAQGGLIAACLASQGVVGAPESLDGAKGFLSTIAGMERAPVEWSTPPDPAIMRGIMCKPYATLGDNMPAAMAAQKLYQTGIDVQEITAINVTLWEPYTNYPGTNFKGPYERLVQTQASTAFAVATMLTQGDITYNMGNTLRQDPAILSLVQKTTVIPDKVGGALDSEVSLTMKNGQHIKAHSRDMPRELIFLNRTRTISVFESRMTSLGVRPGMAHDFAGQLFSQLNETGTQPIGAVIHDMRCLIG